MPCCALLHLCARRKKTGIWCIEQYSSTRPGASIPVQLVQDLEGFSIVDAVSVFCVFCGAFVLFLHAILCCNLCGSFSFMIPRAHKHTDTHTHSFFSRSSMHIVLGLLLAQQHGPFSPVPPRCRDSCPVPFHRSISASLAAVITVARVMDAT